MHDALRTLAALLHKYAPRQAAPVEALLQMAEANDPNFGLDVCGEALWGERGLWDSGPQVLQRPHHDSELCRADELAYRAAFVQLATAIAAADLGDDEQRRRIDTVVATFRAWERDGL
ncbi:MAG: hypothetical protein R3F56_02120 [Planctomycetota bacterium]